MKEINEKLELKKEKELRRFARWPDLGLELNSKDFSHPRHRTGFYLIKSIKFKKKIIKSLKNVIQRKFLFNIITWKAWMTFLTWKTN